MSSLKGPCKVLQMYRAQNSGRFIGVSAGTFVILRITPKQTDTQIPARLQQKAATARERVSNRLGVRLAWRGAVRGESALLGIAVELPLV